MANKTAQHWKKTSFRDVDSLSELAIYIENNNIVAVL